MGITIAGHDISDVVLSVTVPFLVYWATALFYEGVSRLQWPALDKYRIHDRGAELKHNLVSRRKIVATVLAQHILQSLLGLVFLDKPIDMSQRTLGGEAIRFIGAMFVLDAWQFAFHRLFHEVDWLYRNIHIWHHTMYIPHAYGALYQHPVEMVIMDTLSGMVAVAATGCAPITAMFFWSLSYIKVVSDHSGFLFPVNLTNLKGWNGAQYHDVHHSPTGLQLNFCQPWFTFWDQLYGCFKDPNDGIAMPKRKAL